LRVGALFCIINGPNQGRPWTQDAVRFQLRRTAVEAGVRRRFAPHQLRHTSSATLTLLRWLARACRSW
jgi:integrase/recombinase XerD